jgi:hypothetical protein
MTGKDDTMNLIAALRPAILDPAADPDRRARDLAIVNLPANRPATPRRRRVRLVTTVAVVAAAVSTIIFYDSVTQRARPTSARGILLAAATKSAAQQDTGRYWRVDLRSRNSDETTTPAHLAHDHQPPLWPVSVTCRATIWGARSSAEPSWLTYTQTIHPLTAAGDKALKGGAGAVKGANLCMVGALGVTGVPSGGVTRVPLDSMRSFSLTSSLSKPVTMADIRHLPADPARLKVVLDRWADPTTDLVTFDQVETLLIEMPVTSKVRAALYRILADLPLVRSKGSVTDPLGRHGIGLEVPAQGATNDTEIIIDPHTGKILAGLGKGGYTAVLGQGWTDQSARSR